MLCNAEILVDLHDVLPTDLHQIFKGHHGVAHLQGAEHRVDAVCLAGQGDVVTHRRSLRVGSVLLEVPHRDNHALGDLHQLIGESRHFFLGQNAPRHPLRALLFCGKLLIIIPQCCKGREDLCPVLQGHAGVFAERFFGLGAFHLYDVPVLLGGLPPGLAIFVVFHPNLLRCVRRSAHCAGAWWHLLRSCWLSARHSCRTCS